MTDSAGSSSPEATSEAKVPAGDYLPAWDLGDLPEPPRAGWKLWIGLIGPGIVLAGTSIGTGEWLFGPAVTAQYGAVLLWMALISILLQAFCNLMMMRYAVYCGEPIIVGGLRTWPGPVKWIAMFVILDLASIWPYNASNAAVPLAAAFLGRLPTPDDIPLVKGLGFTIFLLAFVPLIFGGTVYRMLEKIMTFKLVVVLGYLTFIAVFMVSGKVIKDVAEGFLRFGQVPLPAQNMVVGEHFNLRETKAGARYQVKGTWEKSGSATGDFIIDDGAKPKKIALGKVEDLSKDALQVQVDMLSRAKELMSADGFYLETSMESAKVIVQGIVANHHEWHLERVTIEEGGQRNDYSNLNSIPDPFQERIGELIEHEGLEYISLIGYVKDEGKLPPLDWAVIVSFIAIAGAGGLTNTMFSNYARDKGWGMGKHVGAIPSAVGGMTIGLSHVGRVFPLDQANRSRWSGWLRHIFRDQSIWVVASILGMALPCMMSLEFIRNATVTQDRVAAMTAGGIADRYPAYAQTFWFMTLFCGFLVLAPGQVSAADQIARRWTDLIWTASQSVKRFGRGEVRLVYYGILTIYGIWGLFALWLVSPLAIAKIGAVLQNIALGAAALQSLYVNRVLLPKELQPNMYFQIGVALCGIFFLGIGLLIVL